MLQDTDFIPINKETVEDILNLCRDTQCLRDALLDFKKYYKNIEGSRNYDFKYELASVCSTLRCYYNTVKEFLVNPKDYTKLYAMLDELENVNTIHEFNKIIDVAADLFYPVNLIPEFKLKGSTPKENLCDCYYYFTKVYKMFMRWLLILGTSFPEINMYGWNSKMLMDNCSTLAQITRIEGPKLVLVEFCKDTSKLFSNTQNAITTSLISTVDHKNSKDNEYGLMYDFSESDLFATSFEDVGLHNVLDNTLTKIHKLMSKAEPFVSLIKRIKFYPTELRGLYTVEKALVTIEKYNGLLLKPDIKPFGIFVWEERLIENFNTVCSLSTVFKVPLYIAKGNGSLLAIPWQDVFKEI